jgi:prepilin-type processing-associated H-X9-DG protein
MSVACRLRARCRHRRGAFTVVEVLVLIGMLAVAVSILLPSLSRARNGAKLVQCLSNLRQLAMATVMYANDNNSLMPAGGEAPQKRWDWIYWDAAAAANDPVFREPGRSALAPYLGGKRVAPGVFTVAPQVLRCPSDRMDLHPAAASGRPRYEYSYGMNAYLCDNERAYQLGLGLAESRRDRWTEFRINLIRRPGHKILFIDHAERTSNDGLWVPGPDAGVGGAAGGDRAADELADRHEARKTLRAREGRGNVSFVDGHAEFVSRVEVEVKANTLPLEE